MSILLKDKILSSIQKKSFCFDVWNKIRSIIPIYWLDDRDERLQHLRRKNYNKLYRKYKSIIDKGVEQNLLQKKSNKIWICWFQGIENAPNLVKCCYHSIQINFPEYEIIVLTNDNISQYVQFPDYIEEKRKKGIISHAHYSDLLRTELLCKYGGIWIDSTVLCTSKNIPEYFIDTPLFMFKELHLGSNSKESIVASSWFISAYNNHPILLLTRELLYQYWKDYNILIDYFLFHIFFSISARRYENEWNNIPVFNNHSPHVLQLELNNEYNDTRWNQITNISIVHKLNHHNDYINDGKTNYSYIEKLYLNEDK